MKSALKNLLRVAALVLLLTLAQTASAMPGPATAGPPAASPSTTGGPPCWTPPCVPIDGGIGILLAAGALVGARKLYRGTRG